MQAIPKGGRDTAERVSGGGSEVEDDEVQVGIAGKKIGNRKGGGGVAVARPDEVFEVGRWMRCGIEGMGGIDEGHALATLAGGGEQLAKEEVTAAAGTGADELGEGGGGEATVGGSVDRGEVGGQSPAVREADG